jgi:Ca2+-binding RTX toxin-like protein
VGNQPVQATFNVQVQADSAVIEGTAGDDLLTATDKSTILKGGTGNDTLVGGAGDDRLIGVAVGTAIAGTNEIDQLTGGTGADLFILGDGQQVYYSTGNGYALIQDFNGDDGDIIQLTGKASDYILTAATSPAGQSALAIQKVTASGNQTIGLVVGDSVLDLNSAAFGYLS